MKIYLGTSGFVYEHWKERFYPENLPSKQWLSFYAKYLNTVEMNVTFYRFPFKNMLKGWYNKTPKNFIITLKANRMITHVKKLKSVKRVLNDFYKLSDLLKEKLGCILFQLPPSLKKDHKRLENFLKLLKKKYKNVIEFRDESWFCEEVYDLLRKYKVSFCIVSSKEMPMDVLATNKVGYIRFHGAEGLYSSKYNLKQLKQYARKLKELKCKELYGYFNNDDNAYAVENCKALKNLMRY